ncbi:hypothetical protein RCL1_000402 [Eukaryota sp. TZLM3-RCL]
MPFTDLDDLLNELETSSNAPSYPRKHVSLIDMAAADDSFLDFSHTSLSVEPEPPNFLSSIPPCDTIFHSDSEPDHPSLSLRLASPPPLSNTLDQSDNFHLPSDSPPLPFVPSFSRRSTFDDDTTSPVLRSHLDVVTTYPQVPDHLPITFNQENTGKEEFSEDEFTPLGATDFNGTLAQSEDQSKSQDQSKSEDQSKSQDDCVLVEEKSSDDDVIDCNHDSPFPARQDTCSPDMSQFKISIQKFEPPEALPPNPTPNQTSKLIQQYPVEISDNQIKNQKESEINELQQENSFLKSQIELLERQLNSTRDYTPKSIISRLLSNQPAPLHHLIYPHEKAELLLLAVSEYNRSLLGEDVVFLILFHFYSVLERNWFGFLLKGVPEAKKIWFRFLRDGQRFSELAELAESTGDVMESIKATYYAAQRVRNVTVRISSLESVLIKVQNYLKSNPHGVVDFDLYLFEHVIKQSISNQKSAIVVIEGYHRHLKRVSTTPTNQIDCPVEIVYSPLPQIKYILEFKEILGLSDRRIDPLVIKSSFNISQKLYEWQLLKIYSKNKDFEMCKKLVSTKLFTRSIVCNVGLEGFVMYLIINSAPSNLINHYINLIQDPKDKANIQVVAKEYESAVMTSALSRDRGLFDEILKQVLAQKLSVVRKSELSKVIDKCLRETRWR